MASSSRRCSLLLCWITICVVLAELADAADLSDELCKRNPPQSGQTSFKITASAEPDDIDLKGKADKVKLPTVSFQLDCDADSGPSRATGTMTACTVTTSSFSQTLKAKTGKVLLDTTSQFDLPTKAASSGKLMECYVSCFAKVKPTLHCFNK